MPNYHPLFVHFPLALLTLSAVFDYSGILFKRNELNRAGWWCLLAGVAGLFVTISSGLLAAGTVSVPAPAQPTFETHEELAFVVTAVFCSLLLWRIAGGTNLPERLRAAYFLLLSVGLVLMWGTAWFGGDLVYRYGIGVTH
jgi:uncharacterized membrane protein